MKFFIPAFIAGAIVNLFVLPSVTGTEIRARWTGPLQAADIGVQTAAGDTADLLVDDLTLRALTDLARARPVSSGGDAPGHPAAAACDGDLDTAVTSMIAAKLDRAVQRCKDNGRQTVRPADL
jgi:hypothetical protein